MENSKSFRKYKVFVLVGVGALLVFGMFILWPSSIAKAQCGSQASSCKNCHEVQGQDPVNTDGTGWHQSHAFGDFCYLCHAGNNQSMDKSEAHTGMVAPLADITAACQSCHPSDLMARAQVYATSLGVSLGEGDAPGAAPTASASPTVTQTMTTGGAATSGGSQTGGIAVASGMVVDSENVVDYNQRYNEVALGQRPINWGNVILVVLIVFVLVGGGAFVYYNERKRRGVPFRQVHVMKPSEEELPTIEGYSPEAVALLLKIAQLKPHGIHALKRLLENPESASELFHSLSKLDPELVNRVRTLDRSSRELLLALSGD